ncbi:hypothetical protein B0H65DRAFT_417278 [Neurospora tetraspora]|uniref:Uncharacterized protein n=1 Tax=Neurospora tetraspora TaxID=94610 RepID=A0AAE0MXR2_9PEZI|nr:hypothetical protein B0H65DRAFT_417278 [Neurospora tetraspora]
MLVSIQPYHFVTVGVSGILAILRLPQFLLSWGKYYGQVAVRRYRHWEESRTKKKTAAPTTDIYTGLKRPELGIPSWLTASSLVGFTVTLLFVGMTLTYYAVLQERRVWMNANNWRRPYLRSLIGREPYPGWSPMKVDHRFWFEPPLEFLLGLMNDYVVHPLLFGSDYGGSTWRNGTGVYDADGTPLMIRRTQ